MKKEIWKNVRGFEGYYEVSSFGRIKSIYRKVHSINNSKITIKERHMKIQMGKRGYKIITLCKKSIYKCLPVHRVVCIAFHENPHNKPCVNHKDGNKLNNHASNLEWVTYKENISHAWKNNLMNPPRGSKAGNSKLTEKDVIKIKRLISDGKRQIDIAVIFGCSDNAISDIKIGRTWKHI